MSIRAPRPHRRAGKPGLVTTLVTADGKRTTKGLGTRDEAEAQLICDGIGLLMRMSAARPEGDPLLPEHAPPSTPAKALELYFGRAAVDAGPPQSSASRAPELSLDAELLDELGDASARARGAVAALQLTCQQQQLELDGLRLQLQRTRDELAALRASALARAAEAAANCPPLADALDAFAAHMATTASAKHARECERLARAFVAQLPPGTRTPAHITADHISSWLDQTAAGAAAPVSRRAKRRVLLGRFVTWAAKLYGYPSPMPQVKNASRQQLQRERGSIDWHELPEVDAALEALPEVYWRPLVATLAFAGLRLAELVWLRRDDVLELDDGRRQLWITSVDDGHGEGHHLKTGNSERAVDVHPRRLWPLLEQHLARPAAEGGAGELFVFPMHPSIRRRPRAAGHPERWKEDTLSRKLSGVPWRIEAAATPEAAEPYVGLLPEGMSARSLRRTFGSLLLRSGRSIEQVAASMGNTPEVVRAHYARTLGSEVSVDF